VEYWEKTGYAWLRRTGVDAPLQVISHEHVKNTAYRRIYIVESHCMSFHPRTSFVLMFIIACATQNICAAQEVKIRTVSSRSDAVSGGSTLAQLDAPAASDWTVYLDNRNITPLFHPSQRSGKLLALVGGLKIGRSTLEVRVHGRRTSTVELINHPLAGPVFSGSHQQPFVCQTEANGLGPPLDANCSVRTLVQYYYKSTEPAATSSVQSRPASQPIGFKPYDPSAPRPSDLARISLTNGRTVNYIVRREIGVINRAVYEIRFLHDPSEPLPTPWIRPTQGWNGRIVYTFGGGCSAGYRQGVLPADPYYERNELVEKGYALVSSTLNEMHITCNDKVSAETASMVKEYFIERYGEPESTIGVGASGAAAAVHLIAQNYPGILDGIIPFGTSQDMVTSGIPIVSDCALLYHAFKESKHSWTESQKAAVSGFATWETCYGIAPYAEVAGASLSPRACDASLPKEWVYDPLSNSKGVRCTYYDNAVSVFGYEPSTGFARRTLDNVGIQYGLAAFNAGKIDAEQFVELNEQVGGYDVDGGRVRSRTVGDLEAIRAAYKYGAVLGGESLMHIPIIEWSPYGDDLGDIHTRDHAFSVRARLITAGGDASNQVILVTPRRISHDVDIRLGVGLQTFVPQMDRWLSNIAADRAEIPRPVKIARNKPTDLADGCIAADGERISERATYSATGRCNRMYPLHGTPRMAADEPVAADVLKCALKPVNTAGYSRPLTPDQLKRLEAVFPMGVCDYRQPGIGHQIEPVLWHKFGKGK